MEQTVKACLNIVVPEGVESIDSYGYFTSSSRNTGPEPAYSSNEENIKAYFVNGESGVTKIDSTLLSAYGYNASDLDEQPGLFSSSFLSDDIENETKENGDSYEQQGNDYIESITLESVKYIPTNCFASCENLTTADLGEDIEMLGSLPFKDCFATTSVGFGTSQDYEYDNGIIYENLTNGGKKVIQCLPSRGGDFGVGENAITYANDPKIADVAEIAEGGFSGCPDILRVDLTSATNLQTIPKDCFADSESLYDIKLPEKITSIESGAFKGTVKTLEVTLLSPSTSLADDAFDVVNKATMIMPEGNVAGISAKKQGVGT